MQKSVFVVVIGVLLSAPIAVASGISDQSQKQAEDVPAIITAGMNAYRDKGPDEAVKTWIKGSALDGSKEALSQSNILRQVQDFYGTYRSFDIVSSRVISSRSRVYYLSLNFDKGPIFAKFVVYRSEQGWILTSFTFNTNFDTIIPNVP
jgi:hypothetical protein